MLLGYIVD